MKKLAQAKLGEMSPRMTYDADSFEIFPAGGQRNGREVSARDAEMVKKLDRAAELLNRIAYQLNKPIPDLPGAGPSAAELASKYQLKREDFERICADAEAAYAAMNPHKAAYYMPDLNAHELHKKEWERITIGSYKPDLTARDLHKKGR